MKLIEKIKEIIEKNEDCEIELGELKITGEFDNAEYVAVGLDYEKDDNCIQIELRAKKDDPENRYAAKVFDIEDISELENSRFAQQELI